MNDSLEKNCIEMNDSSNLNATMSTVCPFRPNLQRCMQEFAFAGMGRDFVHFFFSFMSAHVCSRRFFPIREPTMNFVRVVGSWALSNRGHRLRFLHILRHREEGSTF